MVLVLVLVRRVKAVAGVAELPGAIVEAEIAEPLPRVVTCAAAKVWVAREKEKTKSETATATYFIILAQQVCENTHLKITFVLVVVRRLIKDFIDVVTLSKGDYLQHTRQVLGVSTSFL
jgi:hypothetical protein